MQIARVLVALAGDRDNCVPKEVTAAEIAVLRAIHGDDAVFDIELIGEDNRANHTEIGRLRDIYGNARDELNQRIVERVYPGAAARAFQDLDEIGFDESLWKHGARPAPKVADAPVKAKRGKAKPAEVDTPPDEDVEDDGIGEMADNLLG